MHPHQSPNTAALIHVPTPSVHTHIHALTHPYQSPPLPPPPYAPFSQTSLTLSDSYVYTLSAHPCIISLLCVSRYFHTSLSLAPPPTSNSICSVRQPLIISIFHFFCGTHSHTCPPPSPPPHTQTQPNPLTQWGSHWWFPHTSPSTSTQPPSSLYSQTLSHLPPPPSQHTHTHNPTKSIHSVR